MLRKLFLIGLICAFLAPSSAFAEWYAGGGIGLSMPHDVTDFKGSSGA